MIWSPYVGLPGGCTRHCPSPGAVVGPDKAGTARATNQQRKRRCRRGSIETRSQTLNAPHIRKTCAVRQAGLPCIALLQLQGASLQPEIGSVMPQIAPAGPDRAGTARAKNERRKKWCRRGPIETRSQTLNAPLIRKPGAVRQVDLPCVALLQLHGASLHSTDW